MPNILDVIRETNLTTIDNGGEIEQPTENNVREPHSQLRLNNALVSKVLEDKNNQIFDIIFIKMEIANTDLEKII